MIRIITLIIIIAWSLLLPIYLGNANVRASVIAQNSDELPIDEEALTTNETTTTEEPLTTNETPTEDFGDNATEPQQQPMQPGLNATDAGNATTTGNATTAGGNATTTEERLTTNDSALGGKGAALDSLGEYQDALEYYDRALAMDPNNVSALGGKGAALDSLGEYQDALEYYDRALAMDPNNTNIVNNKGGALGNLGRYEEAMEYIDRALAMDPNNTNIVNNKGTALFYLGREEEALEYYDRALAMDPNNTNALTNKGTALAGLGRYEEAIGYFDRILNIDPNYIPALVNKGAALGNLGRHQEAMEYFETTSLIQESSITTAPPASSNEKNHFVLITNVWEKEYSSRNRLVQYYSNVDLGNLQLDNLKRDKETYALHFISHSYEININKETNTGIAKFNIGDYQGAIVIFDEILRLNEMHPGELVQKQELAATLYNEGLCLEKLGNLTGAEQYKNQAHGVYPNYKGGYVLKADFSPPVLALGKLIPPSKS
jgi:tetratricopeptide (TPR) repeat protein